METVHASRSVSMSEFKKNPAAVLRESRNRPVAVLNHNRPAFYMIEPQLFKAMMDALADNAAYRKAAARLADTSSSVAVNLDQL